MTSLTAKHKTALFIAAFFVAASWAPAASLVTYNFGVLTGARNDWSTGVGADAAPGAWSGDTRTGNYLLSGTTEATVLTGVDAGDLNGTNLRYNVKSQTDGDLSLQGWVNSLSTTGQDGVVGYMTFSLAPEEGYDLNLASITFTGWRNGSGTPDTLNFDYSLDGGTTWLDYGAAVIQSAYGSSSTVASTTFTMSLDIADDSSVLLRFAPYETDEGNNGIWHVTGLSLSGTATVAAVPEPSTYGLMGFGVMLGAAAVRRRRQKTA